MMTFSSYCFFFLRRILFSNVFASSDFSISCRVASDNMPLNRHLQALLISATFSRLSLCSYNFPRFCAHRSVCSIQQTVEVEVFVDFSLCSSCIWWHSSHHLSAEKRRILEWSKSTNWSLIRTLYCTVANWSSINLMFWVIIQKGYYCWWNNNGIPMENWKFRMNINYLGSSDGYQ